MIARKRGPLIWMTLHYEEGWWMVTYSWARSGSDYVSIQQPSIAFSFFYILPLNLNWNTNTSIYTLFDVVLIIDCPRVLYKKSSWCRHQMEIFSALLALCAGNSPVPQTGQWRGALMLSLICAWINRWVNNREAGDLRLHRAHYDINAMLLWCIDSRACAAVARTVLVVRASQYMGDGMVKYKNEIRSGNQRDHLTLVWIWRRRKIRLKL